MTVSQLTAARLLLLADHMDRLPDDQFNIGNWFDLNDEKAVSAAQRDRRFSLNEEGLVVAHEGFCGTTACVLGTAALIPEFNAEGLFIYLDTDDLSELAIEHVDGGVIYRPTKGEDAEEFAGRFGDWIGEEAGRRFFGLPNDHADIMFYTSGYSSEAFYQVETWESKIQPRHVAAGLRRYVETDGDLAEWVIELGGAVGDGPAAELADPVDRYPQMREMGARAARIARLWREAQAETVEAPKVNEPA